MSCGNAGTNNAPTMAIAVITSRMLILILSLIRGSIDVFKAIVRLAASAATTPYNLGYAAKTATLSDPDNLAQDALGNIYVVEDKPNGDNVGGDVWFLRDTDVMVSLNHSITS